MPLNSLRPCPWYSDRGELMKSLSRKLSLSLIEPGPELEAESSLREDPLRIKPACAIERRGGVVRDSCNGRIGSIYESRGQ